jgi:hypothetical protein
VNDRVGGLRIAQSADEGAYAFEAGQAQLARPTRLDRFEVDVTIEPRQRLTQRGST